MSLVRFAHAPAVGCRLEFRVWQGMCLRGGSRGGSRQTGCIVWSRSRTSCKQAGHEYHRERYQSVPTSRGSPLRCPTVLLSVLMVVAEEG